MSLKTARKWLVFIGVLFGIFFGGWISLKFILTMEEMREYAIIYRFWHGVQDGCVFICFLLAFVWLFTLLYSFYAIIRDEVTENKKTIPKSRHRAKDKSTPAQKRRKRQKPPTRNNHSRHRQSPRRQNTRHKSRPPMVEDPEVNLLDLLD